MLSMDMSILLSAATLLGGANAFWRVGCGVIQTGRIDPLVSPGTLSGHAHKVSGASNFGFNSNFTDLFNSSCTSCEITADKSAYWTPTFYYQHGNGTFEEVPNGGHLIYYLGRGTDGEKVTPFPRGFGMVSGNPKQRYYDNVTLTAPTGGRPVADRVSFVCLTDAANQKPDQPGMKYTNCSYGMRAQLHFQTCWDGVNPYLSDNSHVAYMSGIDNGVCPASHPVVIPHLFFELYYFTNLVTQTPGGQYIWSTGDTTGYGFHGDFINGWDDQVQAVAVEQCLTNAGSSGVIDDCPILKANHNTETAWNCPERQPLVNETVHGVLDKIPGCITITSGPYNANTSQVSCPAAVDAQIARVSGPLPPMGIVGTLDASYIQPPFPSAPAVGKAFGNSGWAYGGCSNDTENGLRALTGPSISTPNMTVNYCQSFCGDRGYPYAGLEYGKECYCGNGLTNWGTYNWTAHVSLYSDTACSMRCSSDFGQLCGGPSRLSVFTVTNTTAVFTVLPSATAVPATPASPNSPAGATATAAGYIGCAVDSTSARSLNGTSTSDNTNMTVQECRSFCLTKAYALAGLEYAQECWCGNALLNTGVLLPNSTSCNMGCKGNTSLACGGNNRLSVYNTSALYNPPGTPLPVTVPAVGNYLSQGCFNEATSGRALSGYSYADKRNMTVENCVNYCAGHKMPYAGVEGGSQCYCGKSLQTSSGAVATTGCTSLCAGSAVEYCGGVNKLGVYLSANANRGT